MSSHSYFITYFIISHSISNIICTMLKENYSSTQASQKKGKKQIKKKIILAQRVDLVEPGYDTPGCPAHFAEALWDQAQLARPLPAPVLPHMAPSPLGSSCPTAPWHTDTRFAHCHISQSTTWNSVWVCAPISSKTWRTVSSLTTLAGTRS